MHARAQGKYEQSIYGGVVVCINNVKGCMIYVKPFFQRSKPPKVDKDEDPGMGLMKLMKQMYDDGDDEMKRTIAKAWHESQEKRAKGIEDPL